MIETGEQRSGSARWWRRLRLGALVLVVLLALPPLAFWLLDRLFPLPDDVLADWEVSPVVLAADGTPMHVGLTREDERVLPCPLGAISPHLIHAVLASEDRRFYRHGGLDLPAIARAAWANLRRRGATQGASTITMQLARMVRPQPRTLWGKAVQAFRALQLERRYSKDTLLEQYLNRVPFGGNLRGVEAAAHAWFGRRPHEIDAAEAALLVSVLPAPTRNAPWKKPGEARRRRGRVLHAMRAEGWLDDEACRNACDTPLGLHRSPFPDFAPHAWLRAGEGRTTIDTDLQRAVEGLAASAPGVDGLAIVVVDNETCAVRALVGAPRAEARVLDATARPRSAGSTLKPFLYALALDRGLITMSTPVFDLPWRTREWAPQNFDASHRGPVPAAEALAQSYNLPAVRLAAALPRGAFADMLHGAGLHHVRASCERAAIDLAIGTDDVTPFELVGAYSALARGGRLLVPTLLYDAARENRETRRVCSEGAAALVTRALSDRHRSRPAGAPSRGIAWKTGTSSRRRDAWAVGYTRRYAAVVWRGRLNGRPDVTLVGARSATPLLFAVLQAAEPDPHAFGKPCGVEQVEVCSHSGLAPTAACHATRDVRRPRGGAPLRRCAVHHRLCVTKDGRHLLCPRCRGTPGIAYLDVAIYPPQVAAWRQQTGLPVADVPPHHPACPNPLEPAALRPVLLAPRRGSVFETAGTTAPVVIEALAPPLDASIEILVDGRPVARVGSSAPITLDLGLGRHTCTAVSARGHEVSASLTVMAGPR